MKCFLKIVSILCCGIIVFSSFFSLIVGRDIQPQVYPDLEVVRMEITDEKNARELFLKAGELYQPLADPRLLHLYRRGEAPFSAELQTYLDVNQEALNLCKRGIEIGNIQFLPIRSLVIITPGTSDLLAFASLLCLEAQRMGELGVIADTVDSVLECLMLGEMVCREPESQIQLLVGRAIFNLVWFRMEEIIKTEKLSENDLRRLAEALPSVMEVDQNQASALKAEFQTYRHVLQDLGQVPVTWERIQAMIGEDSKKWYAKIPFPPHFFLPNQSIDLFAEQYRILLESQPFYYKEADEILKSHALPWKASSKEIFMEPNGFGQMLGGVFQIMNLRYLQNDSKFKGNLAAIRIRIAIQRYQLANGKYPVEITELVPMFLESVPLDPMDGKPFRYDPDRKILYSIGFDLVDNKAMIDDRTDPMYKWKNDKWETADVVFPLE